VSISLLTLIGAVYAGAFCMLAVYRGTALGPWI
jgi:hypothetical protein